MRKITKRSAAITAATVIAIGGGAAAWAAVNGWDITGTGTGDATAASITPLNAALDLGAVTVYPGLSTTIVSHIDNPNDFPVKINPTAVTPTGATASGTGDSAACQAALNSTPNLLTASFPNGPIIPKKSNGIGVNATVAVGPGLPQSCSGSHIKVTYTFTAVSTA